jgi:hypothetical protein
MPDERIFVRSCLRCPFSVRLRLCSPRRVWWLLPTSWQYGQNYGLNRCALHYPGFRGRLWELVWCVLTLVLLLV